MLGKVLSEYEKKEIRDEVSGGAAIGRIFLQYEETDWNFLKRLASQFSTVLFAEDKSPYGKVYFGVPHLNKGTILKEKEYTLIQSKETLDKMNTEELLPQEMYRWQIVSREYLQLGEEVSLEHIQTVVTGVDIRIIQGNVTAAYELSRRKGILQKKITNSKIYGMSIPATIKKRKGNQVQVQLDLDTDYREAEGIKWFTYAIETSNFYCMPEEGSRVHIYFPDHEESSAMAVHALRMGKSSTPGRGSYISHQEGSTGNTSSQNTAGWSGETSVQPVRGTVGFGQAAGQTAIGRAINGQTAKEQTTAEKGKEKEETKETEEREEKDPTRKRLSDPSGSFLELEPSGITLSPKKSTFLSMKKSGILTLEGESLEMTAGSNLLIGTGKKGQIPRIEVKANTSLKLMVTEEKSQIILTETMDIVSTFIKLEAKEKKPALPLAADIRCELCAEDVQLRQQYNQGAKEGLTAEAMALKQKEKDAKTNLG